MTLAGMAFKGWRARGGRALWNALAIAGASFLVTLLVAVQIKLEVVNAAADRPYLIVSPANSLRDFIPISYLQRLRAVTGTEDVTYYTLLSGLYPNNGGVYGVRAESPGSQSVFTPTYWRTSP